jgi:hypothetical protein
MAEEDLNPQRIYDSGRFPERTVEAINKQLERCRFVATGQKAFVETMFCSGTIVHTSRKAIVNTIQPAQDAFSMEEAVKFFSTAFDAGL